jgi:hypothetical protein
MGTEHGGGESVRPRSERAIDVTSVDLTDQSGRRTQLFHAGEPLRVAVTLQARRPVAEPRLALEVRSGDGTRVFSTTAPVTLAPGGTTLQFEIARLALLGGDYDLLIAADDGAAADAGASVTLDRAVRFSVAREPGGDGIADLRGSWQVLSSAEVAG